MKVCQEQLCLAGTNVFITGKCQQLCEIYILSELVHVDIVPVDVDILHHNAYSH